MLVYYILILVPLLVVAIRASGFSVRIINARNRPLSENAKGNTAIVLFFLIYFLLLALRRTDVGVDTVQYLGHFQRAGRYDLWAYLRFYSGEYGFYILLKLLNSLLGNEQLFLAVIAACTVFPIMYLYRRESEHPMLTLAFFLILPLFPMLFSGLRQSVAVAFMVPAYYMIKAHKPVKFLLCIFLSTLFHSSAMVALVLYPIYYLKWTRKMLFILVPAFAVLYLFNAQIYILLIPLFGADYAGYATVTETGTYMLLLLFVLCVVFAFFMVDNDKADGEMVGLRNISVLVAALQCFSISNSVASRINYYFVLFLPLLIPRVINRSSMKNRKWCVIIGWVMTGYFIFYFLRRAYTGVDSFQTFPYYGFWQ